MYRRTGYPSPSNHLHKNLTQGSCVIFKTFCNRLLEEENSLSLVIPNFKTVETVFPNYTGTNSSEFYLRLREKRTEAEVQLTPDVSSLWKVYREMKAFRTPEELERASKLDLSVQLFDVRNSRLQESPRWEVSLVPLVFQTA
jgi:hypothetical protein